jgi:hypothetical protein
VRPEVGVSVTDGTVFGRNYFNRYAAPETEEDEFADEHAEILADALALKKAAADYMHPEVGVTSIDGAYFGRNCCNRYSAPKVEDVEEANGRARIWTDALAIKKSAVNYMRPEVGVSVTDATVFGYNSFTRCTKKASPEQDFAGRHGS